MEVEEEKKRKDYKWRVHQRHYLSALELKQKMKRRNAAMIRIVIKIRFLLHILTSHPLYLRYSCVGMFKPSCIDSSAHVFVISNTFHTWHRSCCPILYTLWNIYTETHWLNNWRSWTRFKNEKRLEITEGLKCNILPDTASGQKYTKEEVTLNPHADWNTRKAEKDRTQLKCPHICYWVWYMDPSG